MSAAADSFVRDTAKAFVLTHLIRVLFVVGLGLACWLAYCGGVSHEASQRRQGEFSARDALLKQTLIQIARHRTSDSLAAIAADRAAAVARKEYATRRSQVKLISDTVIQVVRDTVTLSVEVPSEIPALIRRADSTIIADSIAFRAQAAVLADVTLERDTWKARAENDEAQLHAQKRPRFGLRTGLALGASAVGLLVYLVK